MAANWLITTVSVIPSKTFKPTLPSARTTWSWRRDARILRKQNALTSCWTRNCTTNFQPCTTQGYFSSSRTCRHSTPRSKCSTTKRQRFTPSWRRSLTNWQLNHNEDHTHWRNSTVRPSESWLSAYVTQNCLSNILATSNNVQTPVKSIDISSPISYPTITNGNSAAANGGKTRLGYHFTTHHQFFFVVVVFPRMRSSFIIKNNFIPFHFFICWCLTEKSLKISFTPLMVVD